MIGHEAVCMQTEIRGPLYRGEDGCEFVPIIRLGKYSLAAIASGHHVMDPSGNVNAFGSAHAEYTNEDRKSSVSGTIFHFGLGMISPGSL